MTMDFEEKENKFKVGDKVWTFCCTQASSTKKIFLGEIVISPDSDDDGQHCYPYQVSIPGEENTKNIYAKDLFASKKECIKSSLEMLDSNILNHKKLIENNTKQMQVAEQQKQLLEKLVD